MELTRNGIASPLSGRDIDQFLILAGPEASTNRNYTKKCDFTIAKDVRRFKQQTTTLYEIPHSVFMFRLPVRGKRNR